MPDALGDVLERAVAPVAEEPVARVESCGAGRETSALDAVDVEPAVAVVVEQADAAAGHLGELVDRRGAVVLDEAGESGGRGVVVEPGDRAACRAGLMPYRRRRGDDGAGVRPAPRTSARLPAAVGSGARSCRRGAPGRTERWRSPDPWLSTSSQNPRASKRRPSRSASPASSGRRSTEYASSL